MRARGPRGRRLLLALGALVVVLGLPALVGALPVSVAGSAQVSAAQLLAKITASTDTPYQGTAESRAELALPDVSGYRDLSDLVSLLGDVTQLRVWWGSATDYRVDRVSAVGEDDSYGDANGTWRWDSLTRRATRVNGTPRLRLAAPADLLPPELGRRLAAAAAPGELTRIADDSIAGRGALGLRVTPAAVASTVDHVDLWADAGTGLPLRVVVHPRTGGFPLSSTFLDVALTRPAYGRTDFDPPLDAQVVTTDAPDLGGLVDRAAPYLLPRFLAGLPRRGPLGSGNPRVGAGTYGGGYDLVAVVPLRLDAVGAIAAKLRAGQAPVATGPYGNAVVLSSPLLSGLLVTDGPAGVPFVVAGAVSLAQLEAVAADLAAHPPRLLAWFQ